jgi:hypothetical protein
MMKKFLMMFSAILVFAVVFASCSKDDDDNTKNPQFIGTWEHLEYPFEDVVYMIKIQFNEDGTYMADSWEIWFGANRSKSDEGYGLNREQATELIRSKTWAYQYVVIGNWSTNENHLMLTNSFFDNNDIIFAFIDDKLIIPQKGEENEDDENLVFTKLQR